MNRAFEENAILYLIDELIKTRKSLAKRSSSRRRKLRNVDVDSILTEVCDALYEDALESFAASICTVRQGGQAGHLVQTGRVQVARAGD